ncbi:MAG: FGGY-family carbohydrate kinase [Promethearchaeota archaeon]|jgi:sugar (pentulose or hexulose) kinase
MSDLICVFDVGTTGARTIVYDINGEVKARDYEEYQIPKQAVGISEHDPLIWWNAIKKTCNTVSKKVNVNDIVGISAAFLRQTVTFLDKNGDSIHPALTWLDEREESSAKEWVEKEGAFRRAMPKILWIKRNKPEIFEKTSKIAFVDTYILNKLCEIIVTDPTNGYWGILNLKTLDWDTELGEAYDVPVKLWPDIKFPGEVIGELSGKAAKDLNLPNNIPIIMGTGDQQCSALGLGVIETGQAKITMGTGTFVDYVADNPIKPPEAVPITSIPTPIKGKWNIEAAMPGTGTALKWFKDNFSQLQIQESTEKNLNIYDMLSNEASTIPPGSEGLLVFPLYMFRKGTIRGLGWNHTRAHLIRAIMESAALSAQMYLQIIEAIARSKVSEVKADGGAMNSPLWAQILADITSRKVLIPEEKDSAAMGAAILGFCGTKTYGNFEKAIASMVRFVETKEPIKQNMRIYKKLNRLFMPHLLDLYEKKRITKGI